MLLDGNLNPKISDFGLARLDEEESSHVITRVAGTMSVISLSLNNTSEILIMNWNLSILFCRGYMAPEYALWGYLSCKADVYSYGIVVLEIVSGNNNKNYMPSDSCVCLLDKVLYCMLQSVIHFCHYESFFW